MKMKSQLCRVMRNEMQNFLDAMIDFDHHDADAILGLWALLARKAVVDAEWQQVGFIDDVLISSNDDRPQYAVIEAKKHSWQKSDAKFCYPLASVTNVDFETIHVNDTRLTLFESLAYDPEIVDMQQNQPLLSLRDLVAELHMGPKRMPPIFNRGMPPFPVEHIW